MRSTLHRVSLPTGAVEQQSRYSIACFCQPDPTTQITCIDSCQSPEQPSRYAPVAAGDYLVNLLKATY